MAAAVRKFYIIKIIPSDEAQFHLDRFVYRQNCVAFVFLRTHIFLSKNKCIHNVSLFSVDFGLEALRQEIPRCINEIQPHLCRILMEIFEVVCVWKAMEAICPMCNVIINSMLFILKFNKKIIIKILKTVFTVEFQFGLNFGTAFILVIL